MNERSARIAIAIAFLVYVFAMRTYDVATTFLMLGEQTRDWRIALGGITDLPLAGAPSTAGGRGLGPAYYWLLWLGRVTLGPFMDNLPHVGGIIVALLQSIGDTWLFIALSRRVPWTLALAMCLLVASGPFDIAISSVLWNPPVAAALIKMAIASALTLPQPWPAGASREARSPVGHAALTAALAWMALQTHLSAAFPATALLGGVAIHVRRDRMALASMAAVVMALQVPFVVSLLTEPAASAGPTAAIASITSGQSFRPFFGLDVVSGVTGNVFLPMPDTFKFWIPATVAGLIVLVAYRRDPVAIGASIGGVAVAALVFAAWTRGYDRYWFLTLVPALALTFTLAIAALRWRRALLAVGAALTVWFATWQTSRIDAARFYFEYPQYETVVRGSRELVARAPVVKDIRMAFDIHPTMERQFVYTILGGRIDPAARFTAIINADGSVRLDE